jgi:hypothetical protein
LKTLGKPLKIVKGKKKKTKITDMLRKERTFSFSKLKKVVLNIKTNIN